MKTSLWTRAILCSLVSAAICALAAAALSGQTLRVSYFNVTTNADSSRTQPLVEFLDGQCGSLFFAVSPHTLCKEISAFNQVEKVTVHRIDLNGFDVNITLREPLLAVTNGSEIICLGPEGIPFSHRPEHGTLPVFYVPNDLTSYELLEPDSSIREFYNSALNIVSLRLNNITGFCNFVKANDNEIQLADHKNSMLLRLPRKILRDPVSSLISINQLLETCQPLGNSNELDARFKDIILVRPLKGASLHG